MVDNKLKQRLKNGETCVGTFISTGSPDLTEIAALSGLSFVVIDYEHSFFGPEKIQHMIRAAELRGITPIIRIPSAMEFHALHIMDMGGHGIQVPQVNQPETARNLVTYTKYFPDGKRGLAGPRSGDYGLTDMAEYLRSSNEQTMIITHCENQICLDNLEEICQVPGIDVIFLGPYDMSQSLGVPGQIAHQKVSDAAKRVVEVTKKYNKVAGVHTNNGAEAKARAEQGFRYITMGGDLGLFALSCKRELEIFGG